MDIFLINSPLFSNDKLANDDILPPLGLGYIATYLKTRNIEVKLIDSLIQHLSLAKLKFILSTFTPKFIGINIFSTNYKLVKELIETLEFKTHVIIGGISTSSLYPMILKWNTKNQIDIVIGDGELITYDIIINNLSEVPYFENINRRVFKVDMKSKYFINDTSILLLDRFFLQGEPLINYFGNLEVNIITGRGCIYNCTYCAAARSINLDFPIRERTNQSILCELLEIQTKYPDVRSIRIMDDLFLKSKSSIVKAINIFTTFNFQWRSMAHVKSFDKIEQKVINALRKSGCTELFIGIESGSPAILKSINKTSDLNIIIDNLIKVFKAKINVKGYFIYGFPDETIADMEMTYNLACNLKKLATKYRTNFRTSVFQFRPYHGTLIYNSLKKRYPDLSIDCITPNDKLTKLIGRRQFNFQGNNYSKVSLKTIHDYICKTNMI